MSHNLDSPVQTQMAVSIINHGCRKSEPNSICKRRVFVQTDMGCVLGIELDRRDNAHTVKRKLQLALNFPIEDSSLTCGDRVLENENDLNAVKKDSPLLLTRKLIHRSASTPCLSPTAKDLQQRDRSGLVEVLGCGPDTRTKQLVQDVIKAIKSGVDPVPVNGGLGGAYNFRNSKGDSVAIVKPTDEEPFAPNNPKGFVGKALGQPGLKRSVRVGETGYREVAAYLLDYDNFANVPPTVLVKVTHSIFNVNSNVHERNSQNPQPVSKIASFQQFIPHDFDASDHGTSSFSVSAVHRIGILDIRIFNTDRHAGNLLVKRVESGGNGRFGRAIMELIPIDHGLCLPENLEDPYFEWIHWPQASIPFSEEELKYIAKLDPVKDSEMLKSKLPMIREACLRVLVLSTIFLKEAASFGLCLAEIGEMMSREFTGGEEEPSELEVVCIEARKFVSEREVFVLSPHSVFGDEDETQFLLDSEDISSPFKHHYRNPFSRLGSLDEEDEEDEGCESEEVVSNARVINKYPVPTVSNISMSLREVSISKKTRSANEQVPASASFVKVADMSDEEWRAFLEKFQELLHEAFRDRKCGAGKQKQRLGTSCQF